jgi:hypothetical protein
MNINQQKGVDRAGRGGLRARAIPGEPGCTVRVISRSDVGVAVGAFLVAGALVLVGHGKSALGQAQEPPANPAEPAADKMDLSQRYRFLERYGATDDPTRPELLIQYRVAIRENIKVTSDNPQGAPSHDSAITQCIYTERVTKLARGATVTEVVRHYDKVDSKTSLPIPNYKTKPLEGLVILYRLMPRSLPQILCLPPVRQLRQQEYKGVVEEPFLPALASILPRKPSRVGDTWPVPREAAWAVLGEVPADEDYDLIAEILEVRKNKTGSSMVAVIGVKGQVVIREGPSGINAQVHFTFVPSDGTAPAAVRAGGETPSERVPGTPTRPGGRVDAATDANGYISKVSLAEELTIPLPGQDGRLRQKIRLERVLERRPNGQDGKVASLLEVPTPDPVATVANSWLIYDDPRGRFHLLHPQELRVDAYPDGGIDLMDPRPDGRDVITIGLNAKTQDSQRDPLAADPNQVKKQLEDQWKQRGEKVVPGPAGWLPEPEWSPLKRQVYRIEAALIPEGEQAAASGRIYLDHYMVLFTRNEVLTVSAMTTRDPHVQFREKAESIIKTFEFGPSESSLPAAPTRGPLASPAPLPTAPSTRGAATPRPR